jgi:hypothetical protein
MIFLDLLRAGYEESLAMSASKNGNCTQAREGAAQEDGCFEGLAKRTHAGMPVIGASVVRLLEQLAR